MCTVAVCLLDSCNLRFQLATSQTSFFDEQRHACVRAGCRLPQKMRLKKFVYPMLISRGHWIFTCFLIWFFNFRVSLSLCTCVCFICKLTVAYSLLFYFQRKDKNAVAVAVSVAQAAGSSALTFSIIVVLVMFWFYLYLFAVVYIYFYACFGSASLPACLPVSDIRLNIQLFHCHVAYT